MLSVGLTGGIGSGKSTVAEFFEQKNIPIIDADLIAKNLVNPGEPALNEIIDTFGSSIINQKGELDRAKLRSLIFRDATLRNKLNAILHPRVHQEIRKQSEQLIAPYCIVMIPLLVENALFDLVDRVLVVDTLEKMQLKRTAERDNVPEQDVQAILNIQATRETRIERADDIIENLSSLEVLQQQVSVLHRKFLNISEGGHIR